MNTIPAQPVVYTVKEAAAILRISKNSVYRLVQRGQIRGVRLGRLLFIPRTEIERIVGTKL